VEGFPGTISVKFSTDVNGWSRGTKCRRNIAENFNRLSMAHERYRRQTTDRQTIAFSERERENRKLFVEIVENRTSAPAVSVYGCFTCRLCCFADNIKTSTRAEKACSHHSAMPSSLACTLRRI